MLLLLLLLFIALLTDLHPIPFNECASQFFWFFHLFKQKNTNFWLSQGHL